MAKVSEVAICNYALASLGESPIISLDDDSVPASLCKSMYPIVRDAAIEAHNWTFATRWYKLPKATGESLGEFHNQFPLPAEVLRVVFAGVDSTHGLEYEIEDQSVMANSSTCVIKAIVQVTDPFKFSSMFVHALSAFMASELAIPIVSSQSIQQQMYQVYGIKVAEATSRDQIQGTSKRITASWINSGRRSRTQGAGPTR